MRSLCLNLALDCRSAQSLSNVGSKVQVNTVNQLPQIIVLRCRNYKTVKSQQIQVFELLSLHVWIRGTVGKYFYCLPLFPQLTLRRVSGLNADTMHQRSQKHFVISC